MGQRARRENSEDVDVWASRLAAHSPGSRLPDLHPRARPLRHGQVVRHQGDGVRIRVPSSHLRRSLRGYGLLAQLDTAGRFRAHGRRGGPVSSPELRGTGHLEAGRCARLRLRDEPRVPHCRVRHALHPAARYRRRHSYNYRCVAGLPRAKSGTASRATPSWKSRERGSPNHIGNWCKSVMSQAGEAHRVSRSGGDLSLRAWPFRRNSRRSSKSPSSRA